MPATGEDSAARAQSLLDLNRPQEALPLLAQAIASEPNEYRPRCLMALALVQLDRDREAVEAARDAVRLAPEEEWPQRLLSVALTGDKKFREAVEAGERAVALAPEKAETHIALATALTASERGREAGVAASQAVKLAPEDSRAHAAVGQAALTRKDLPAAERAFRKSLELDPEDALVQNNLGVVLIRQGRREEAMKLFESSARTDPRDDLSRRNLTATARRMVSFGGVSAVAATFVLIQIARIVRPERLDGGVAAAVVIGSLVTVLALLWVYRRRREGELTPAVRALLADDRRRARRRPWTWDASGRWLPWPIWLLLSTPPQVIAVLGGLVLILMVANSGGYSGGDWAGFAGVVLFTTFFVLRWRDMPRD